MLGDKTGIEIYGSPSEHKQLAEHITCEIPHRVYSKDRVVDEWRLKQRAYDNHFLDCLYMNAAAAVLLGLHPDGQQKIQVKKRIRRGDIVDDK